MLTGDVIDCKDGLYGVTQTRLGQQRVLENLYSIRWIRNKAHIRRERSGKGGSVSRYATLT